MHPRITITPELFEKHRLFFELHFGAFYLQHLRDVYRNFSGDILLAIVLGEIAHQNIAKIKSSGKYEREKVREIVNNPQSPLTSPCNAYSLASSTGIPRETVRRKVAKLVKEGLITVNEKSDFFFTVKVSCDELKKQTYEGAQNIVKAYDGMINYIEKTNKIHHMN